MTRAVAIGPKENLRLHGDRRSATVPIRTMRQLCSHDLPTRSTGLAERFSLRRLSKSRPTFPGGGRYILLLTFYPNDGSITRNVRHNSSECIKSYPEDSPLGPFWLTSALETKDLGRASYL